MIIRVERTIKWDARVMSIISSYCELTSVYYVDPHYYHSREFDTCWTERSRGLIKLIYICHR